MDDTNTCEANIWSGASVSLTAQANWPVFPGGNKHKANAWSLNDLFFGFD